MGIIEVRGLKNLSKVTKLNGQEPNPDLTESKLLCTYDAMMLPHEANI